MFEENYYPDTFYVRRNNFEDTESVKLNIIKIIDILNRNNYNGITQFSNYLLNGDTKYITHKEEARDKILDMSRLEIIEFLLTYFINNKDKGE